VKCQQVEGMSKGLIAHNDGTERELLFDGGVMAKGDGSAARVLQTGSQLSFHPVENQLTLECEVRSSSYRYQQCRAEIGSPKGHDHRGRNRR